MREVNPETLKTESGKTGDRRQETGDRRQGTGDRGDRRDG
jgi:hypothetical protein